MNTKKEQNSSQRAFWDVRYETAKMPWDFGGIPARLNAYLTSAAPERILIPGCGSGCEIAAFHSAGWSVTALDFSPEVVKCGRRILGRLGDLVVSFNRLSYDDQLEIANLLLDNELEFLRGKEFALTPDKSVLPFLVQRGFHPKLGARPMRDAIEKLVGDAVSTDLLTGGNASGLLAVDGNGGFLSVQKTGSNATASIKQ